MSARIASVPVVPQTLEELLEANEAYLNWLDSIGGEEAKQEFLPSLQKLATPPAAVYYPYYAPVVSYPTHLTKVGGISLSPYTHRSPDTRFAADPLNVIFTGEAEGRRVADIFTNVLFPPEIWLSTMIAPGINCAETQWVYFTDGKEPKWQQMNHTLAMGSALVRRCHIRLFDGGYDEQLGKFTLGGIHYEHWDWLKVNHVIEDWDRSQDFVQRLFEAISFCKGTRRERLQGESEELQRVTHDGLASIIELQ